MQKALSDSVGRGDAMLCLDANIGSSKETYFLLGALCSAADYLCKVSSG